MHMFSGGLTPWKVNKAWSEQIKQERLAEQAARLAESDGDGKKKGPSGMSILMALAGGTLVWSLFTSNGIPMQ